MPTIRDLVLQAADIESEVVDVAQWGVKIEVRGMTVEERLDYAQRATNGERKHIFAELLLATCYDPDTGERVFDRADRDALSAKAAAPVEKLVEVAQRLSGLGDDRAAEVELGKVESDDSSLS
jgi:hypothetical protein